MLDIIITKVENGTLKINTEDHISHLEEVKEYLTVVNIEKFSLADSKNALFQTALKGKDIFFELSGSGSIKISQLTVAFADMKISGSSSTKPL